MNFKKFEVNFDINNPTTEEPKKNPKQNPSDTEGQLPYEMPELQITEVGHTPEKGTDSLPWMIQSILEEGKIEKAREKIKKELPN